MRKRHRKPVKDSKNKSVVVSVVIPCYNQANYLPEAVESVICQTFSDWECLVVNDGSPDNTSDVARALMNQYPDRRIRLIEKENGGLADARNAGISQALGRYILPLDADDKLDARMLEMAVSVLEAHPDIDIVYTDVIYFGVGGERRINAGEFVLEKLALANQLNYCALYRRKVWEVVGGYNRNMVWGYEDWDFWVGALEKGCKALRIAEPLFLYRVKSESMYTKAVQHDAELKARLVLNHPRIYSEETRRWAERALAGEEGIAGTRQTNRKAVLSQVGDLLQRNDLLTADQVLQEARGVFTEDAEIINAHGNVLGRLGRYEEARRAFEQVISLAPGEVMGYSNLAGVLFMDEKLAEAEQAALQALRIAPSDGIALKLYSLIQERKTALKTDGQTASQTAKDQAEAMVSVIVPTFNRPKMLVRAIRSILAQTYQNFEIIVVNDCGEDVEEVVRSLDTVGKIRYIRHEVNKGLGAARNTGIRAAAGKYIAYLDDDDQYYPIHLETLARFLESSDYRVAYSDAYRAHQRLENGEYVTYQRDLAYSIDFDADLLLAQNITPVLCVMHEKACVEQAGFFDESLNVYEDWDFLIRLSRYFPFAHIKQVTSEYSWRTDGTTMSSSRRGFYTLLPEIYRRYQQYAMGNERVLHIQQELLKKGEKTLRMLNAQDLLNRIIAEPDMEIAIAAHQHEFSREALEVIQLELETARSKQDEARAVWLEKLQARIAPFVKTRGAE